MALKVLGDLGANEIADAVFEASLEEVVHEALDIAQIGDLGVRPVEIHQKFNVTFQWVQIRVPDFDPT